MATMTKEPELEMVVNMLPSVNITMGCFKRLSQNFVVRNQPSGYYIYECPVPIDSTIYTKPFILVSK